MPKALIKMNPQLKKELADAAMLLRYHTTDPQSIGVKYATFVSIAKALKLYPH